MTDDPARAERHRLSGGRLLARNTFVTLAGQAVVLALAFLSVPLLIDALGDARFGLLAIAWVVIGYSGVLDLGLGRALTAIAADRIGTGRDRDVPELFWTALATLVAAGTAGTLLLVGLAPLAVGVLDVSEKLESEAAVSIGLLGVSLPVVLGSQALRAMLDTEQRADLLQAVQVPASALSYFGPVLLVQFSSSLVPVVAVVVASRVLGFAALLVVTLRAVPRLRERVRIRKSALGELLRFGGWVTVSNVVAPVMHDFDRVFVGVLLTVSAVTYYAAPSELVRRLWVVSSAIAAVLFPAFALTRIADPARAARLFGVGNRTILAVLFPLVLVMVTLAFEILQLWLGTEFAERSESVLQWLAVGALANALAQIPFGFVTSSRPDLTAKAELVGLPLFLGCFWLLVNQFGLEGAGMAWMTRQVISACFLYGLSAHLSPLTLPSTRRIGSMALLCLAVLLGAAQLEGLGVKVPFLIALVPASVAVAWRWLLGTDERVFLREQLRARGLARMRRTQKV